MKKAHRTASTLTGEAALGQVRADLFQVRFHGGEDLIRGDGDGSFAGVGSAQRVFVVDLQRPVEIALSQQLEELRESNHSLTNRLPLRFPASLGVFLPDEVFQGYAAEMRGGGIARPPGVRT